MGSIKASKNGEFKSQVPHVMLHLNPGVARHQNLHIQKLDKLKNKVCKTIYRGKLFGLLHF